MIVLLKKRAKYLKVKIGYLKISDEEMKALY
jgi:hypothetical protein